MAERDPWDVSEVLSEESPAPETTASADDEWGVAEVVEQQPTERPGILDVAMSDEVLSVAAPNIGGVKKWLTEGKDTWLETLGKSTQAAGHGIAAAHGGLEQQAAITRGTRSFPISTEYALEHAREMGLIGKDEEFDLSKGAIDNPRLLDALSAAADDLERRQAGAIRKDPLFEQGAERAGYHGERIQELQPDVPPGSAKYYVGQATQSFFSSVLPAMGASIATGGAALPGLTLMGTQVYGQRLGEQLEKGRDMDMAQVDAMFYALSETIPETIPLGIALKRGTPFIKRLLGTAGAEGGQEMITEVLQAGYDAGVLDENMTFQEALRRVVDAGIVGSLMGGGMATVGGAYDRAAGVERPQPDLAQKSPDEAKDPWGVAEVATEAAPQIPTVSQEAPTQPIPPEPSAEAAPVLQKTESVIQPTEEGVPGIPASDVEGLRQNVSRLEAAYDAAPVDRRSMVSEDLDNARAALAEAEKLAPPAAIQREKPEAVRPTKSNLVDLIASSGGLSREEAEAQGIDPAYFKDFKGKKPLFPKQGGMTFDEAAELVQQHGYGSEDYSANELLDMLDRSLRGETVMPARAVTTEKDIAAAAGLQGYLDAQEAAQAQELVRQARSLKPVTESDLGAATEEMPDYSDDDLIAGQRFEESEYDQAMSGEARALFELHQDAKQYDESAADGILEAQKPPSEIARGLFQIIQEGKKRGRPAAEPRAPAGAQEQRPAAQAPAVGPGAVEPPAAEEGFRLEPQQVTDRGNIQNKELPREGSSAQGTTRTTAADSGRNRSDAAVVAADDKAGTKGNKTSELADDLFGAAPSPTQQAIHRAREEREPTGPYVPPSAGPGELFAGPRPEQLDITRPERRHDTEQRKHVAEMSPDEMRRALLLDDLTGLPNRRAYEESQKKDVQVFLDMDSLKWINDNLGHDSGDQILRTFGEILRTAAGNDAYHLSGDEFIIQADTVMHADAFMHVVHTTAEAVTLEFQAPDGKRINLTGLGFSYGYGEPYDGQEGPAYRLAEIQAANNKTERENLGLRAKRGEPPAQVSEKPAVRDQAVTRVPAEETETADRPAEVDEAAHEAATSPQNKLPEPTEAQKEAGNYQKGHITLRGLDISIENPAGTRRRPEWPPLKHHYGYIKGTVGKDKDHIDVFLGPTAHVEQQPIYVVDQIDPESGAFDEHKVMIGFESLEAARQGYLDNYAKGWKGLGNITETSLGKFKDWLDDGDTTKPFAPETGTKKTPISTKVVSKTSKSVDAAATIKAAGLTVRKTKTNKGNDVWEVGGNTRTHKDLLKSLGGRWYGPKKVWSFYKGDPIEQLAARLPKPAGYQEPTEPIDEETAGSTITREEPTDVDAEQPSPETGDREGDFTPRADRGEDRGPVGERLEEPDLGPGEERPAAPETERTSGEGSGRADERPSGRGEQPSGGPRTGADVRPERGTVTEQPTRSGTQRARTETPSKEGVAVSGRHDFTITDEDQIGAGGLKTKYKNNVAAIRLLKLLEEEDRLATPDEQKILAKYVGWGGIKGAFDPDNKEWGPYYTELKELLTPEEYEAARRSILDAHYTSVPIVRGIWAALDRMGFRGGRVLEPSVGVGNFLGLMPKSMRSKSDFFAVELDRITGAIARQLYQHADIASPRGFQDVALQLDSFDVVVGNPPFGNQKLFDAEHPEFKNFSIHNYFIAKSINTLRPGGILNVVVSRYFLDSQDGKARKWIAQHAKLIGAIRLPYTAFKDNANTEVVTDIIVLQKKTRDQFRSPEDADDSWTETTDIDVAGTPATVNRYFADNPFMVLGQFARTSSMYAKDELTVEPPTGETIEAGINRLVGTLPENIFAPAGRSVEELVAVEGLVPEHVKVDGYFVTEDGKLARRAVDSSRTDEQGQNIRRFIPVPETPKATEDRIRGMITVRDALRNLMRAELTQQTDTGDLKSLRAKLNRVYDAFQRKHGFINSLGNRRAFQEDPDLPLLESLEPGYDPGVSRATAKSKGIEARPPKAEKAAIFSKRVLAPFTHVTKADNPKDSLMASLNERGSVDLDYMSEITGTDKDTLTKELAGLMYLNPETEVWEVADEYLTGNVKAKLYAARETAKTDPRYAENVQALEKVQPPFVNANDISVRLGSTWVPPEIVTQFGKELLGVTPSVGFIKAVGKWSFKAKGEGTAFTATWGTRRMSADEIIESLLNLRAIVIKDNVGTSREPQFVVNEQETSAARAKAEDVQQKFKDWIWLDQARRERLEKIYNDVYNTNRSRQFDGDHMSLPGMSPAISLRQHQKAAIWRIIQDRIALLDHVVGAGKTYEMVGAAMELRRMGLARKPMFTVPNHLVRQWRDEFYKLYPNANILATTEKDFQKGNRQRLFSRIATGDWDAVIVAHSSFKKIGMPAEEEQRILTEMARELTDAIEEMKRERGDRHIIRDMERIKERLTEKVKSLNAKGGEKDRAVAFDELGVDALFVDEAHMFKNLFYFSQMQGVTGLGNPTGSGRAFDLFVKTRYLQNRFGGKGITVFATGTPVSNSLVEMFTMQRYLIYDDLKSRGIHLLDSWARVFGDVQNVYEVHPSGSGYRLTNRFAKFVNMPELMTLYRKFADVITMDDLKAQAKAAGKRFPVPKLKGGKPQLVVAERSPQQVRFFGVPEFRRGPDGGIAFKFDNLRVQEEKDGKFVVMSERDQRAAGPFERREDAEQERLRLLDEYDVQYNEGSILWKFENLRRLTKDSDGKINALSITNEARKAGLDFRLIDPNAGDFPGSKLNTAVDNILRVYQEWSEDKGTQLVFCDLSVPKTARDKVLAQAKKQAEKEQAEALESEGAEAETAEEETTPVEEEEKISMDQLLATQSTFSVYDDVKQKLIAKGVPENRIAFIHDYDTADKKNKLFQAVRDGTIRVLLGSTEKMGAGMNVQDRLVAVHHLDAPWRPSDLEQRNGRIIRQGNKLYERDPDGFEVQEFRYATKQTYDTRMWQIIEHKARGVEQLRKADETARTIEDISGEAASAADMKAAASGNPLILDEIKLRNEVRSLEAQEQNYLRTLFDLQRKIQTLEKSDDRYAARTAEIKRWIAMRDKNPSDPFKVELGGKTFTERKNIAGPITEKMVEAHKNLSNSLVPAGIYRGVHFGFQVSVDGKSMLAKISMDGKEWVHHSTYGKGDDFSPSGFLTRIDNSLERLDKDVEQAKRDLERDKDEMAKAREEAGKPFPKKQALDETRVKHREIVQKLQKAGGGAELTPEMKRELHAAMVKRRAAQGREAPPEPKFARVLPQTETHEFKRWFGDSKVVDDNGKPLVVYHGTSHRHAIFRDSHRGKYFNNSVSKEGFFFTDDREVAERFAEYTASEGSRNKQARVIGAYLSLQNPIEIDGEKFGQTYQSADEIAEELKKAKKAGHDGAIIRGWRDGSGARVQYVAFLSAQIKSSDGNRGTFDPNNPDIRFAGTQTPAAGLEATAIEDHIAPILKLLKTKVPVTVVESYEDLPPAVYDRILEEGVDVQGVAYDGRVYLVASQIQTLDVAERVLLDHELRHIGLRELLGRDLGPVLTKAFYGREHAKIMQFARERGLRTASRADAMTAAEEYIVNLAETKQENTLLQKVYAAIRDFLRRMGFKIELADVDLRDIVARAGSLIERGNRRVPKGAVTLSQTTEPATEQPMFARRPSGVQLQGLKDGKIKAVATPNPDGSWEVYIGHGAYLIGSQGMRRQKVGGPKEATKVMETAGLTVRIPPASGVRGPSTPPLFKGFDVPAENVRNYLLRKLQDRFRRVKVIQHAVKEAGGKIDEQSDAYLTEELFYGKTEERIREFHEKFVDPLIQDIRKHGVKIEDVDLYLYAKHAPERNAHIAEINPYFRDNDIPGSGMSDEEARKILDDFEAKGVTKKLEDIAGWIRYINRERLNLLEREGLESTETLDLWRKPYKHYVPLRGFSDTEQGDVIPRIGRGFDIRGKESRRALGRSSLATSPLTYTIVQMEESIIRAEKNNVGKSFLKLVEANPNPELWEINKAEFKPRYDKKTGEVVYDVDPRWKLADNVLSVKQDGEQTLITIHDEALAGTMKRIGAERSNQVVQALGAVNRFLAAVNTSLNPEFVLSNFTRDLQTAMINLYGEQGAKGHLKEPKGIARKVLKDLPLAMSGIYAGVRGVDKAMFGLAGRSDRVQGWSKWFDEYRKAGGKIGFFGLVSIETRRKQLHRALKLTGHSPGVQAERIIRASGDLIMDINTAVENGVRLATYKNARELGLSEAQAASLARNLTVNFNRKGELGAIANSLYLFYNASLQGSVRLLYAMRSKRVQAVALGIVGAAYMLAEMNRWLGGDDEDDENFYNKIVENEPWLVEHNIIIMKPDGKGGYYKIPLPYGYNVLHILGTYLNQVTHSGNPKRAATRLFLATMNAFNPLGSDASLIQMISPTIVDPLIQVETNENFYGAPISPEQRGYGPPKPDSQMYWNSVSPVSKAIAERINAMTGGSEIRPGAVDVSPESIDYMISQFFGGSGAFVNRGVNYVALLTKGKEVPANKIPFVRRFVGEQSEFYVTRVFFDNLNEVYMVHDEIELLNKSGRLREAREKIEDNQTLLGLYRPAQNMDNRLQRERKKIREIRATPYLSEEEKDKRIETLRDGMNREMKMFNKEFRKAVGR